MDYLEAVTALLQRGRAGHPTIGLYEAAELQWWWRSPRRTDETGQLFWFDDDGRPEAGVVLTDWGSQVALDPMLMPDAAPDVVAHVVDRGLAHAASIGIEEVSLEVDRVGDVLIAVLAERGFAFKEEGLAESWLATEARPPVSSLADGYQLAPRSETPDRPHYGISRGGPNMAARLQETSLYRTDLDLTVLGPDDGVAAYGIFWHDPTTATGVVEPMRTEEGHQQRGLARHVLTAGLDRLANAGAQRIKICYEPGNLAARHLYLSVGFEPVKQTDTFSGPTHR